MRTISEMKVFAALPATQRGKCVRLGGDPKDQNFLYCNGKSVFIRGVQDPTQVDVYTQHSKDTAVARYSPSRFYIASCDIAGNVRIWDTVNPEHILKAEYPALGGCINDVDWSPDGQNIVVCGNGREKFAHVFGMDTGTSKGSLEGHSKSINACSYRPGRPFSIVTAGEDHNIVFCKGLPFKFARTQSCHSNFVNVARYSPDGHVILSGGADGKVYKFDGKTCDKDEDFVVGHGGGIYEICFRSDGLQAVSVSGDKVAKIFEVETGKIVQEFEFKSKKWEDMLLGCLWQGSDIIAVNGSGHLIYLDMANPQQPKRVIKGHQKAIKALALSADKTVAFTGGLEGIIWWDVATGKNDVVSGSGHTSSVTDMVVDGDCLISVGIDDMLRFSSVSTCQFSGGEVKMDSQPQAVDSLNGIIAVACIKELVMLQGSQKLVSMPLKAEASCVNIHPNGSLVAVGFKDKKVRIYSLPFGAQSQQAASQGMCEERVLEVPGEVSCLAYSPNGTYLACGAERSVITFSTNTYEVLSKADTHTARVMCLGWSPDSSCFATAGLDSKVVLWEDFYASAFKARPSIKAHTMSHGNKLAWVDTHTFMTAGDDSNVKFFTVSE